MNLSSESFWVQIHDLPIACMNEDIGTQIRKTIGRVKACDVQSDDLSWGIVLRTLIELDLHKPIARGCTLNVKGDKTWVPLTYEKLPKICFRCGRISHEQGLCNGDKVTNNSSSG